MNQTLPFDPVRRRRNRIMLVLLVLCFVLPLMVAVALQQSGWRPEHTANRGTLLQPPVALADLALRHADGSEYRYAPQEARWQIAVVPPADCGAACGELLNARLPGLATSGAPSAYLIDPRAFLLMHYAPGFDPGDLRADVAKLLK